MTNEQSENEKQPDLDKTVEFKVPIVERPIVAAPAMPEVEQEALSELTLDEVVKNAERKGDLAKQITDALSHAFVGEEIRGVKITSVAGAEVFADVRLQTQAGGEEIIRRVHVKLAG